MRRWQLRCGRCAITEADVRRDEQRARLFTCATHHATAASSLSSERRRVLNSSDSCADRRVCAAERAGDGEW
eukprot:scaffold17342_cov130-Isochrysis_galbana.AAC.1